jgi:hypothetical protein
MFSMMNTTGWNAGFPIFWGLHVLSIIVFAAGIALLLFWAFKHLSERQLWKWGWTLVIIGTVACLIAVATLPSIAFSSPGGMFWGGSRFGMMGKGMMGSPLFYGDEELQTGDAASQTKEEADGKALYDELQAKTKSCADLVDSDFELIGEYVMGQRLGASHEQMNQMMQRMMGQQGEEQMHILMGKRFSGCDGSASSAGTLPRGMMNGGGMMRQFNSSSR